MLSLKQKKKEAEKNGNKDEKVLHYLINNLVYGKKNGKLKKYNRCKTCRQQKKPRESKPSYTMSHKIFDNDLVVIRKNKVTLTLNKSAYIGMGFLELSKVLMYEFH